MNRLAPQLVFITFATVAACKHTESNYCEDVPVTHNCMDKIDADTSCTSNAQCSGATPVCDVGGSNTCVQCTTADASACSGATPVCGTNNTCEGCTMHAQCTASSVCLPEGACADVGQVAYVAPTGSGTACTKASPCKLVDALAGTKLFIKISGTLDEQVTASRTVTILADPGAKLRSTTNGILLKVDGNANVKIYDLEISGASGGSGNPGISMQTGNTATLSLTRVRLEGNTGGGVIANGGTLAVTQSTVTGNTGGGIAVINAAFDITNNFIFRNGDPDTGQFGGVNLNVASAAGSRFEFNTLADNRASSGATRAGGVICDIAGFTAPNNIIARNYVGGMTTPANAQTLGQCAYPTSKVQMDVSGLALAAPDMAPFSYKLTAGSSAMDQATTSSPIVVDYDGETRPKGAQKDIGADEFQ